MQKVKILFLRTKNEKINPIIRTIVRSLVDSKLEMKAYVEFEEAAEEEYYRCDIHAQEPIPDIVIMEWGRFPLEKYAKKQNPSGSALLSHFLFLFEGILSHTMVNSVQEANVFELFPCDRFAGEKIEYAEIARFTESIKKSVRALLNDRILESELKKPIDWKIQYKGNEEQQSITLAADPVLQKVLQQVQKIIEYLESFRIEMQQYRKDTKKSLKQLQELESNFTENSLKVADQEYKALNAKAKSLKTRKVPGILITGPTGCGKTRITEWIARKFLVADYNKYYTKVPFVNIPETLIDSELFGSFPGAFTGATYKTGKLLSCAGGVIFLDEIGEIPSTIQAKLLTYMDDRKALIEGYHNPEGVLIPALLIGATNRNLTEEMKKGDFRNDLYHRFIFKIRLPALKDRKSDFRYLLSFVLQSEKANIPDTTVQSISIQAIETLEQYDYPGNFRELEEIVRHALLNASFEHRECILRRDVEGI